MWFAGTHNVNSGLFVPFRGNWNYMKFPGLSGSDEKQPNKSWLPELPTKLDRFDSERLDQKCHTNLRVPGKGAKWVRLRPLIFSDTTKVMNSSSIRLFALIQRNWYTFQYSPVFSLFDWCSFFHRVLDRIFHLSHNAFNSLKINWVWLLIYTNKIHRGRNEQW